MPVNNFGAKIGVAQGAFPWLKTLDARVGTHRPYICAGHRTSSTVAVLTVPRYVIFATPSRRTSCNILTHCNYTATETA